MARELRLGTRGSQLALWQARAVASQIAMAGGPPCQLVVIRTSGDHAPETSDTSLADAGGKRLFVKEIEEALLDGQIDLAVHSSKDLPAILPEGLVIGGVLKREDPRDAMVLPASRPRPIVSLDELVRELGDAPTLGTGSVRRVAQLARLFSNARFAPIRGNLDTRLRKLDGGSHDALVLAAAGLRRLGLASRITMTLPVDACVPAPGQGIIAIEVREADRETRQIAGSVDDPAAGAALAAERALVEALGGGCQTPIGALATPLDGGRIELVAAVAALDGSCLVRAGATGRFDEARALGARVAADLVARGAGDILGGESGAERPRPQM